MPPDTKTRYQTHLYTQRNIQQILSELQKAVGPFNSLYSLELSQHWPFNVFLSKNICFMYILPFSLRFQKSWHC